LSSFAASSGVVVIAAASSWPGARRIGPTSMGDFASGKSHVYRMNAPLWHSVIIRSEYAAIHEVTNGPFRIEESEVAPWAPEEPGKLRDFLAAAADASSDT